MWCNLVPCALLVVILFSVANGQIKILDNEKDPVKHSDDPSSLGESSSVSTDISPRKFICPGIGRYAVKRTGGDRCSKYYVCKKAEVKPDSVRKCNKGRKFNRLSRTCVRSKFVECKWCKVEDRHVDITSSRHFIECLAGSIALRYRCISGKYNDTKQSCEETDWKVMDVTVDAELDPPEDIEEFQKKWTQKKQKGVTSTLDDQGKDSKTKPDNDNEPNDDDGDENDQDSGSKKKGNKEGADGKKKDDGGLINIGTQGAV